MSRCDLRAQNRFDSRNGPVALNESLVLAQELHPRTSMVSSDVFEGSAAATVLHDEELGTVQDEELHKVGVGLARPAGVVEGGAAHVVAYLGADVSLGEEKVDNAGERSTAGHVEEGFAEFVGGLECAALGALQGAEGIEILAADGRDGFGIVGIVVRIVVFEKVVLEGKGGYRGDGWILGL